MPIAEKVSIIVPVYNTEKFLDECIKSIIKQTYTNIEVLLINDGSTDQSLDIIEKYSRMDNRIQVINKINGGVSHTRNIGIEHASGAYVMFVDSDDMLLENAINRLVSIQKEYKVDIVFGSHCYGYKKRRLKRIPRIDTGLYQYDDIKDYMIDDGTITGILFGSVAGNLYNLEFIKSHRLIFENSVKINEDGLFNLECVSKKVIFFQYNEYSTYLYRQWKSGKKKDYRDMIESFKSCDDMLFDKQFENITSESMEKQKGLRKITEIFQISVTICESEDYKRCKKGIKRDLVSKRNKKISKVFIL